MIRRLLPILLLTPSLAFGWGFAAHRRLASNLEEPFANGSCLRSWLLTVTGSYTWQQKATAPDSWRSTDPNEAPRHYLNIDYAPQYNLPIEGYPRDWAEAQNVFGQYAVKNGTVPWRVEEMYAQLVNDFKAGDGTKALETVAYLSHYVTDSFSPMHDTKEQPGTCGGTPECLHLRYESDMMAVSSQIDAITQLARSYYGAVGRADPRNNVFDDVIVGWPVSQKLIADDAAAGGDMTALYNNTKDLTARRWGDALTLMASLIGSAWVDAGRPMLAGMPGGCSTEVPQGELALVGYPLPVTGAPPDAGTPESDAGVGEPAFDGGSDGNQTGGEVQVESCGGCGGGPVATFFPMFALGCALALRRRR